MHTHAIPRLLLVGLALALVATGLRIVPTAANPVDTRDWSTTQSYENVLVQTCGGSVVNSNHTTTRLYHQYRDSAGHTAFLYQHVSFAGVVGNATTGKSYAYDGHYTRIADFDQGSAAISDLLLRFEVGSPGMFTVSFAQIGFDLIDNPPSMIQAIVPNVLQMDLCRLLGGSTSNVQAELWIWDRPMAAKDKMTPWTELDPCDTVPSGQSC